MHLAIFEANIVLSRTANKGLPPSSLLVFTRDGEVLVLFFYIENVAMREKDSFGKTLELLSFLTDEVFKFFI